jgi:hypothetical protein
MVRACSVLQFHAINTLVASEGGELGGFQRHHGRALPFVARPRQHDGVEDAAVAADEIVAARCGIKP